MSVPPNIRALADFAPVEDVVLPILRDGLSPLRVQSLIEFDQHFPMVHVRRAQGLTSDVGDPRFIDSALIQVHVFTEDPDGDEAGAVLSDAVRAVLWRAYREQTVVPGRGWISFFDLRHPPKRASDWATATGPVQYADLPTGVLRYESLYQLGVRRPFTRPYPLTP